MKRATEKIVEGFQEPTWEDCRPVHFGNKHGRDGIMKLWDTWRKYIKKGGTASWPRDEFEMLVDGYEENIRDGEAERSRLSKLLVEARIRIMELEARDGEVERSRLSKLLIEARIRIVGLEEELRVKKQRIDDLILKGERKGGRWVWK